MILWIRVVKVFISGAFMVGGRFLLRLTSSGALFILCHFIAWQYIFHSQVILVFRLQCRLDDRRHHFALFSRTKWKLTCIILHVHKDVLNVLRFSVDIHIVVSLFDVVWIICYRHSSNGSGVTRTHAFFNISFPLSCDRHTVNCSYSLQYVFSTLVAPVVGCFALFDMFIIFILLFFFCVCLHFPFPPFSLCTTI